MGSDKDIAQRLQDELSEKIQAAVNDVITSRNQHYRENPSELPDASQIQTLIDKCAMKNAAISGGASLMPGPWGMIAVVPELVLVTKNQIELIYDIGAAHGKKEIMTKELLVAVFLSGMGATAGSVLVMHGSRYLLKRASLRVMQRLVTILGGRIAQQAIKSAVSKWFPGIGAMAMAAWTNYLTKQVGRKADEILRRDIMEDPNFVDVEPIEPVALDARAEAVTVDDAGLLEFYKIQVLIGLARIDGTISNEETDYIENALANPSLTDAQRAELCEQLGRGGRSSDGLRALAASPDDAIGLLSAMTALAGIDNRFHATEKLYIRQIGKLLGFSEDEVAEVMSAVTT